MTITEITNENARNRFKKSNRWRDNFERLAVIVVKNPIFQDLCGWNGRVWIYITTNKID